MGEKYIRRTAKNALHELGELFLPLIEHCKDRSCFMSSPTASYLWSISRFKAFYPALDRQRGFCKSCSSKMERMIRERGRRDEFEEGELEQILG
jgi:predicted Zn-dependent protease